jgi:predicted GTPase
VDDEEKKTLRAIADAVQRIEDLLQFLPDGAVKDLRVKIGTLRGVLLEHRPPALVLIGRRGAGKSSLVNALYGAKVAEVGHVKSQTGRGKWFEHERDGAKLAILDTRGVQEGSVPEEADDAPDAVASIVLELKRRAPDVVVFLIKATEVDSAIDGDLDALERVLEDVEREHHFRPPVIAIATHCDLLEPKKTRLHEAESEHKADIDEKLVHVASAERHLENKLRARGAIAPRLMKTLGVSTYLSWRADGTVRDDDRWRIDDLSRVLFTHLPDAGRGTFVRIARVRGLQEELATNLTRAVAALCAGVAAIPIPVADLIPLTGLQVSLIAAIAWLGGRKLDMKSAGEFMGGLGVNIGLAFALREGARALIKYVFPGAGSAVSGAVAFAGTMALGAAARAYFIRGEPIEAAKKIYQRRRESPKKDDE